MRSLAIETASEACSVALFDGESLLAHEHSVLGRGHAEALIPMIAALPDRGRADRVLVSLGPGSFTGVRIGVAAARALGFAWGAEVLGYPTLALVAAQAMHRDPQPVTVCMNGGHGEWFVQDFDATGPLDDVRSMTPDAALARGSRLLIAGNRAEDFAALLGSGHNPRALLPDARAVPLIAPSLLTGNLMPVYGRAPDATPQKASGA